MSTDALPKPEDVEALIHKCRVGVFMELGKHLSVTMDEVAVRLDEQMDAFIVTFRGIEKPTIHALIQRGAYEVLATLLVKEARKQGVA